MAEASDVQGIFHQNLIDAGCGPATVERCVALSQRKKTPELLRVLASHRNALLDAVHGLQAQIDCLDYLVYKLEKDHDWRNNL